MPNDVTLDAGARQLIVLTGPNMGGKSTYLRQTALLCLMAQAGSFVPARSAKLPVVDRIFARVGASDNIARGQSTFMVEMQETANILHSATSRSLLILDEIGRGTSTFDGLSLAWAVAEHLASNPRARPKTIFATHYHELTDLADALPNVTNCHVVVREWQDDIVFLRKVVPGRSDRSYGIQVARLAGLPPTVVARAREILNGLERDELSRGGRPSLNASDTRDSPPRERCQPPARALPGAGSRGSAASAAQGARRRQPDAAAGTVAPRRAEARGGRMMGRRVAFRASPTSRTPGTSFERRPRQSPRGGARGLRVALLGIVAVLVPLLASASGRYDPRLRFQTISTPRFDIHFHQGEEAQARRLAMLAETFAADLDRTLGPAVRPRAGDPRQPERSSRTAGRRRCPSTRSRSSAAAPGGASLIGNTDDWLRMVFAHEYTHIVHLSRGQGWIGGLRRVFGRMPLLYPESVPADVAD